MPYIIYKNKNGERVPSVSTIKGQWGIGTKALMNWAWEQGDKGISLYEKQEADIGTLAHLMIEYEIKGKEVDLTQFPMDVVEQAKQCYANWQEWKERNKFEPVESELSLVSEKHQYGGTIDIIAIINDKLSLVDIKTGKEVYEDHIIQLVAYKQLWDENFPENPLTGGFHIIRTGKEMAMFSHNWYDDFPCALEVFLMLRKLYDLHKEIKKLK